MKQSPERKTRGASRYRALRDAGLCTLCRTSVTDGKICCPACREKRKQRKRDAPTRTACFVGAFCTVPLSEVLEVLRLRIDYHPDYFEFTGSREFKADRLNITPFDALRDKGLLETEAFEAAVAAHRKAQKKKQKPRMCRIDSGECESEGGV